ncbi:WAT1-related protein At5g64700 [Linum perenne]
MDPKTTPFLNDGKKAYGAVVLTQLIYAGMFLFSKAAFDGGLNTAVFVFYRQAFAAAVLVPLALSLEWKHAPPLPAMTFCKIFALSLGGITLSLNINGVALIYTSATLAAATVNSLPVITFFLALLCGMETLKVKTRTGIAKLIGIGICMGGVATLAFYKGPHFNLNFCLFGHHPTSTSTSTHTSTPPNNTWIKGCFLMLFSNVSWGFWLVFQAILMKSYPSKLLFTALQCFLSAVQSFVVAIAVERNPEEWKLGWNMRLVAVAYCGVVVTGVTYYLQAWVLEKKGPVFLASSTPLALIFTMVFSALLCDFVTLGRYAYTNHGYKAGKCGMWVLGICSFDIICMCGIWYP